MKVLFIKLVAAILKRILFRHCRWIDPNRRSRINELLYHILVEYWAKFEYLREKDPDKREDLKALAMGGNSGKEWARQYDAAPIDFNIKIGDLSFNEALPIFGEMDNILKSAQSDIIVIQIGSSSGREVAYFAGKYLHHTFIGTDIYQEVLDYSAQSHQLKNLSFRKVSAKDIGRLLTGLRDKEILVFSDGSLQYVQPEHLPLFFATTRRHGSAKILLCEPIDAHRCQVNDLAGSKWRGNFSYTHNYRYYAEKEGIKTIKSQVIQHYPNNPRKSSTFYYYGEADRRR